MGWVAPLVPLPTVLWTVALLEALLLGAIGLYRGVSSLVTLLWQPSCHGGMGSLFGMCTHKKNTQTYST